MQDLRAISGQQSQLKWDDWLQKREMLKKYLLCVIDVSTKYAWVKTLKDKKSKTVFNASIEIVNESDRKPNRSWFDHKREIYNYLIEE